MRADDEACEADRIVHVKKKRNGRDRTIAKVVSANNGTWKSPRQKESLRGRFYAVAKEAIVESGLGQTQTCAAARSRTIRVRR